MTPEPDLPLRQPWREPEPRATVEAMPVDLPDYGGDDDDPDDTALYVPSSPTQ